MMGSEREIFVFKGQTLVLAWLLATIGVLGFLGNLIARQNLFKGSLFLLLTLTITLLVGALMLAGRSDVIIDDQGISRRIFGKTWQRMDWDNIRLIRAFPVSGGGGYSAQAYNIYPKVRPRFAVLPAGKMSFTDKMTNSTQFIEHLHRFASAHSIRIEPPL
jgi:hypothetical protein